MKYSEIKSLRDKNNVDLSKKRMGKLCFENTYLIELLRSYGITDLNDLTPVEIVSYFKIYILLIFNLKIYHLLYFDNFIDK